TKTDEALAHGTANGELAGVATGEEFLPAERCRQLHRIMLQARAMEERMIKMSKSGEGFFWIGGPGEEAFNAALGLHVKKGQGPDYDYLHLHYRNSATLVAMGMPLIDGIRQMGMTITDPHSAGRNPGAPARVVDGNDPVASWFAGQRAMKHCRTGRRPFMLEAMVSRLHGHSSSSGAARVTTETDCIALFEKRMIEAGVTDAAEIERVH